MWLKTRHRLALTIEYTLEHVPGAKPALIRSSLSRVRETPRRFEPGFVEDGLALVASTASKSTYAEYMEIL